MARVSITVSYGLDSSITIEGTDRALDNSAYEAAALVKRVAQLLEAALRYAEPEPGNGPTD
jgi:hypothetical protein